MKLKKNSLLCAIAMAAAFAAAGCGGGGGSTELQATVVKAASLSGAVEVPDTIGAARVAGRSADATVGGKALANAKVTVSRLKSDGTLEEIAGVSAMTNANGEFTLTNVPEENNLVLTASKIEKVNGRQTPVSVSCMASVDSTDSQAGAKTGVTMDAATTLVTAAVKDILYSANQDKPEGSKIKASDLPYQLVDNLKKEVDTALASDANGSKVDRTKCLTGSTNEVKTQLSNLEKTTGGGNLFALKTNAATKGSLNIKVIKKGPRGEEDERGNKVTGATVVVTVDGVSSKATTNDKGDAFFGDINVGKRADIEVSIVGYTIVKTSQNIVNAATVSHVVVFVGPAVVNQQPVAKAGPDKEVLMGQQTALDGSKSFDPDGTTVTYSWAAPTGITLSSTTVAGPTFTPSTAGTYTFSLVVSDGSLTSEADTVTIKVVASACSTDTDCSDANPYTTDTCLNPGAITASCTNVDDTPPYVIEFIPSDGTTGTEFNKATFSVVFNEPMDTQINYNDQAILTAGGFSNTIKRLDTGTTITLDYRNALYAGTFNWSKTYQRNDTLSYTLIDNSYLAAQRVKFLRAGFEYEITKRIVPTNLQDPAGNALDRERNIQATGKFWTRVCKIDDDCNDYDTKTKDTCAGAGTATAVCKNETIQ